MTFIAILFVGLFLVSTYLLGGAIVIRRETEKEIHSLIVMLKMGVIIQDDEWARDFILRILSGAIREPYTEEPKPINTEPIQ